MAENDEITLAQMQESLQGMRELGQISSHLQDSMEAQDEQAAREVLSEFRAKLKQVRRLPLFDVRPGAIKHVALQSETWGKGANGQRIDCRWLDPANYIMGRAGGFGSDDMSMMGTSPLTAGDVGRHPKWNTPMQIVFDDREEGDPSISDRDPLTPSGLRFVPVSDIKYEGQQKYYTWRDKIDPNTFEILPDQEAVVTTRPKFNFVTNYNGTVYHAGQTIKVSAGEENLRKIKSLGLPGVRVGDRIWPLENVIKEMAAQGVGNYGFTRVFSSLKTGAVSIMTYCKETGHMRTTTSYDQPYRHPAFDIKLSDGSIKHVAANEWTQMARAQGGLFQHPRSRSYAWNTGQVFDDNTKQWKTMRRGEVGIPLFLPDGSEVFMSVRGMPGSASWYKSLMDATTGEIERGSYPLGSWDAGLLLPAHYVSFMSRVCGPHLVTRKFCRVEKDENGKPKLNADGTAVLTLSVQKETPKGWLQRLFGRMYEFKWDIPPDVVFGKGRIDDDGNLLEVLVPPTFRGGRGGAIIKDTVFSRLFLGGSRGDAAQLLAKTIEPHTHWGSKESQQYSTPIPEYAEPMFIAARIMGFDWFQTQIRSSGLIELNKAIRIPETVLAICADSVEQSLKALKDSAGEVGKTTLVGIGTGFALGMGVATLGAGVAATAGIMAAVGAVCGVAKMASLNKHNSVKGGLIDTLGFAAVGAGVGFLSPVMSAMALGGTFGFMLGGHKTQGQVMKYFDLEEVNKVYRTEWYKKGIEIENNTTTLGMGFIGFQIKRAVDACGGIFHGLVTGRRSEPHVNRVTAGMIGAGLIGAIAGYKTTDDWKVGVAGASIAAAGYAIRSLNKRGHRIVGSILKSVTEEANPSHLTMSILELFVRNIETNGDPGLNAVARQYEAEALSKGTKGNPQPVPTR